MGCTTGIVKYLVFIANLVFALSGLALITLGCIFRASFGSKLSSDAIPSAFSAISIITIIVGSIIFIIAFFGCCGALRESTCMLTTYAVILLSIFIIQIAIGVFSFIQTKDTDDFRKNIKEAIKEPFGSYTTKNSSREEVDALQDVFKCCGLTGPKYWDSLKLPTSCCESQSNSCTTSSKDLYEKGCVDKISDFVEESSSVIGYVIIGIAATELIGAIIGFCLASSIRNEYRRSTYN